MISLGKTMAATRGGLVAGWTVACIAAMETRQRLSACGVLGSDSSPLVKAWARGILDVCGVSLRAGGADILPPPKDHARLVVANHRSPLDIPVLLSLVGGTFLSRGDIEHWPVLGRGARLLGTVFVDRDDTRNRASAIRRVHRVLRDGATVSVFPEGTTHAGDDVRSFHAGIFASTRGLPVEILPVGLTYDCGTEFTEDSLADYASRIGARRKTKVCAVVGTPFLANEPARVIAARAHAEVQELVALARARH